MVFIAAGAEPILQFLETGPGVLVGFSVSVLVILIGVGFMLFMRSDSVLGQAEVSFQSERALRDELQRSKQGRERAERERDALKRQLEAAHPGDALEVPPAEQPTPEEDREIRELEIQERWRAEDALEAYLNQMQQWLDSENRQLPTLPYEDPRRRMARTRTLTVLGRLDPNGKREVLRFLHEHRLIVGEDPVIRLGGADLSNANLVSMNLTETNLSSANLSGADMSRAQFCSFIGHSAGWGKSIERGGGWDDLMQPIGTSDLSGANLSRAVLKRTLLSGCNLIGADFAGADLDGTDIRGGADLRLARDLTQEQIEQAYGSAGQQEYMPDTLLPDYLEAPEAWEKLISQQIVERSA